MKALTVAVVVLLCGAVPAAELSVTEVWQAASVHDPAFAAARASRDAGRARGRMGTALWLPTLTATGSKGSSDADSRTQGAYFAAPGFGSTAGVDFRTDVNNGSGTHWAVVAQQSLFDADRLADSVAHRNAAKIAAARFHLAEQDLIVRSAGAYFEVLNARAVLGSLQRLHTAANRARAEAQARYESGDIPVTDMREAQARADSIGVQELDAQTAVELSEAAFADLTGLSAGQLGMMPQTATDELPTAEPLASWVARALGNSPMLTISALAIGTANAQVSRYSAFSTPRVSLVAQLSRDSLSGNGNFGATDISMRQRSVSVQASFALFTGGMRSAQQQEARALAKQAEAEADSVAQQVRQQARRSWLALTTAAARVRALRQLQASAASRLDATRLGAEIGDRNALELLNAEADFQRAGADFQRAQSDWLLASLELKAAAGELRESDLADIDRRLGAAAAAVK